MVLRSVVPAYCKVHVIGCFIDSKKAELSAQILSICKRFILDNNIDGVSINCQYITSDTTVILPKKPPMPAISFAINIDRDIVQP